ncbi:superoxide dismutase [Anaerolinea sp.]|uniref:superoxide dismutase n=1 Tax=Anaerolinea sp. TaxID=1872519 RepID=UPI002ACD64F9|nr:superoxide dismutase [Anaerolinea sp.]
MAFELPPLPYAYDALEPYIDARTVELHYSKHHMTYLNNLNAALEKAPQFFEWPLEKILSHLDEIPEEIRMTVRNNGGGVFNHNIYWAIMGPNRGGEPVGNLARAIEKTFGSFASFKEQLEKAGLGRFGSGWAWLSKKADGTLVIHSTPNQDTPLAEGLHPIIGVDVWEHAYYLKYQNRRAEYLSNWWNLVNWEEAEKRYNGK